MQSIPGPKQGIYDSGQINLTLSYQLIFKFYEAEVEYHKINVRNTWKLQGERRKRRGRGEKLNQPQQKLAQIEDHTDKRTGIACLWIGVGSLNPIFAKLRIK